MSQACSILAWKARPTQRPARRRERLRPVTTAAAAASAAHTSSRTRSESETLPRFSATVAGVQAHTTTATMAAAGPHRRRTAR